MDELKPIKSAIKQHKERKYLEDKIKEPQTLVIKAEPSATDTDQVTAAFGNFLAHMPDVEVPWHIENDKIVLHKEEIATKAAKWNSRPDEFQSKHGFPEEMSSNLEHIAELEQNYAEMAESGDFSKAAEAEREFLSKLEQAAASVSECKFYRTLDELHDDLVDFNAEKALEDAPVVHIICHDVCSCRMNCCENPDVAEFDGHYHCENCDDICEESLV